MFDHLLESSRWDDYNKWSNIGFGEEIGIIEMKIHSLSGALNAQFECHTCEYVLRNYRETAMILPSSCHPPFLWWLTLNIVRLLIGDPLTTETRNQLPPNLLSALAVVKVTNENQPLIELLSNLFHNTIKGVSKMLFFYIFTPNPKV